MAAGAEVRVGGHPVVVHLREADADMLANRLEDRPRAKAERAAHRADTAHRSVGPSLWLGAASRRAATEVAGAPSDE